MSDVRTIPAIDTLGGRLYVVASGRDGDVSVYGRYAYRDVAERVCEDLNRRYHAGHYVAKVV